jgi:soluble lytic murein transglycosylase-like protein
LSPQGPPSGGNPPLGAAAQAEEDESSAPGPSASGNNRRPVQANPTATEAPSGQPAPGATGPAAAARGSSVPSRSGEPDLDRWDAQIQAAAESTGLPPNYIKGTIWAESRGKPETETVNGGNGHIDKGLMQISDHTYGLVMKSQPNAPRGLRADNPNDNIMMGAWELKDKAEKAGGDLFETSKAYVGTGDAHEEEYATWVQTYTRELDEGKKLSNF